MSKYSEKNQFASAKRSLINLIIGIWMVIAVIIMIGVIIMIQMGKSPISFLLGGLLGSLAATGFSYHMYYSIDIALDMGERAEGYTRKASFLRSIMMIAIIAFSCFLPRMFHPVATFLGLYSMKLSIYIQPIVSKIQHRRIV